MTLIYEKANGLSVANSSAPPAQTQPQPAPPPAAPLALFRSPPFAFPSVPAHLPSLTETKPDLFSSGNWRRSRYHSCTIFFFFIIFIFCITKCPVDAISLPRQSATGNVNAGRPGSSVIHITLYLYLCLRREYCRGKMERPSCLSS